MKPVRYRNNPSGFEDKRAQLNTVLAFCGYYLNDKGQVILHDAVSTLSEAQKRASKLRHDLLQRNVHADVLLFCREELLQENYFHAVFEATKSVADKLRNKTELTGDGSNLVEAAFDGSSPILALNSLRTETEKSEQKGFSNLLKGMFGTFRNVTAHAPKIKWVIDEQDALDLFSLASYLHRRLDNAVLTGYKVASCP